MSEQPLSETRQSESKLNGRIVALPIICLPLRLGFSGPHSVDRLRPLKIGRITTLFNAVATSERRET